MMANPPIPNFPVTTPASPSSKVEISVSCRNLANKDALSKSDPMCVLYMSEFGRSSFLEAGRTEMIKDTLNPDFVKKFIVEYRFEELQKLRFTIYDVDSPSQKLTDHDYLGQYEINLGELVSTQSKTAPLGGKGYTGKSTILVRAEEVLACNDVLNIKLSGHKLDKKDFLGKSDPFLVFYKCNEDQSFTAVHKTEVVKNTLNPVWREFSAPVSKLCNGDINRTLKVECYDWDSDGSHDLIGVCLTNVKELNSVGATFELVHPQKKAKKKSYKNSGTIKVENVRMTKDYGFLDYIKAGISTVSLEMSFRECKLSIQHDTTKSSLRVQINFTVSIDFTQSNGQPSDPRSLHYITNTGMNQYSTALMSVGNIIQDYDSDKMFPALGFGGKLPDGTVSHEFFLNGNPQNPFCAGIGGIMHAYQNSIRTVQLWGPTNFSPVINHVARFASTYHDGSNYFILLIITDGIITDMPQTIQAIISASSLPMSIIIVGVGQADFSAMEELDADNQRLSMQGRTAERDIVQFVPLRDFLNSGDSLMSQAKLAKAVLAEVPGQFLSYMKKRNITPPPQRLAHQPISGQPSAPSM